MGKRSIALFLADETNDYQNQIKQDVLTFGALSGFNVFCYSASNQISLQIVQIYSSLYSDPEKRPDVILILPVRDNALDEVAYEVISHGIGWFCLNRPMPILKKLREEFPLVPISFIGPDHFEIGQIQGRQFRALLPKGGHLLYVQGSAVTSSANARYAGMQSVIDGSNIRITGVADGHWSEEHTKNVMARRLAVQARGKEHIDLIGCQNDAMAIGTKKALESVAKCLDQPELSRIPVTGVDGLITVGQRFVDNGQLAATIIYPSSGKPAIDLLTRRWSFGDLDVADYALPVTSYPNEEILQVVGKDSLWKVMDHPEHPLWADGKVH
jgi:ABC-type sugar transport system substrate-binding protein